MTKIIVATAVLSLLSACAANKQANQEGFYTWVDASGNVRTEQRRTSTTKDSKVNGSKSSADFNPEDFTPAEQVDKQLQGDRLYTWMEDGRQQVTEASPVNDNNIEKSPAGIGLKINASASGLKDISAIRTGKIWQYAQLFGREIPLSQYYSYSQSLQRDYLLIDIYELDITSLIIRSFSKNQALAYPHFIQLDNQLNVLSEQEVSWQGYNHESWASYGHLMGRLSINPNTGFLLIMTRKDAGIMEVDDKLIKLVDLGSIEIAINE